MDYFDYKTYRELIKKQINLSGKKHGQLSQLARHLKIHTTTLSQILKGTRDLNSEQAVLVADYFGLNENKTKYLYLLVQFEKANNELLRKMLAKELAEVKRQSKNLKNVLKYDVEISDSDAAIFYSNWYYSAVRILTSVVGYQTPNAISKRLGLDRKLVNEIISFLVSRGLCVEKNGKIIPGPSTTHLNGTSPMINRHLNNWRLKATERHPVMTEAETSYSGVMTLSTEDAALVRKVVVDFVEQIDKIRAKSTFKEVFYLNVDWLKL